MPITAPFTATAIAAAITEETFYLIIPKGTLRSVRVGNLDGPITINHLILQYANVEYGQLPLLTIESTGEANDGVGWDGELPVHNNRWRLKIAYTGATIGDRINVVALVDV